MTTNTPEVPPITGHRRRWPPALRVVLFGTLFVRAAGFSYPFLAYRLSDELGWSSQAVGWILAVFGAGWLVGQLLVGTLADAVGRRTTLLSGMVLSAVVFPVLGQSRSLIAVTAAAFVSGLVYDALRPIATALIADLVPTDAGRAAVAGWRHFALNVGAAVCGAIGGLIANWTGGLGILFWFNGAACAAFALVVCFMSADTAPTGPQHSAGRSGWRTALTDSRLWLLWAASVCSLTCVSGLYAALPLLMDHSGLSAASYSWTQVANALGVLVLTPMLTPWLTRRAGRRKPMIVPLAASSLALGLAMGSAGFATTTTGYAAAAVAAVPGEVALIVAASDVLNRISPVHLRGMYAGIWGSALAVAIIASPAVAAWALATGKSSSVAASIFSAGLLGALLCLPLSSLLNVHLESRPEAEGHH